MKKLTLLDCSVVLVSKEHVSVNYDFFVKNEIIPSDFQKRQDSFSSPMLSQLRYTNGFNIILEPSKTVIQLSKQIKNKDELLKHLSQLKDISSKYVESFKSNYQAIGINFDIVREDLSYDTFSNQVIKQEGKHLSFEDNKGKTNSIGFSYSAKGKQFNVSILRLEPAPNNQTEAKALCMFKVNIHYPGNYAENKITIINELESNYEKSKQFINKF